MRYILTPSGGRLRPGHLLLMIYRYLSGIYQVGDLSALNYVRGFLDASNQPIRDRILTVSGHGIGEAEMWLAERTGSSDIDVMSFRLQDTQLLQFLRTATPRDIDTIFRKFSEMVAPYEELSRLASDPGLVPYWHEQSENLHRCFETGRLTVFSDPPMSVPSSRRYGLIYVSQGGPYFTLEAANLLRQRLVKDGLFVVLNPATSDDRSVPRGFADSKPVVAARELFWEILAQRGYDHRDETKPPVDLSPLAKVQQSIKFSVLAPASAVLVGELILTSLNERISDRDRLEVLEETAKRFRDLSVPVNEELELSILEGQ